MEADSLSPFPFLFDLSLNFPFHIDLPNVIYVCYCAHSHVHNHGCDLLPQVNTASLVKQLTPHEAKKLLRSGNSKHGAALTYLSRHSMPPSKLLQEHTSLPGESVPPTIVPKAATLTAQKTHSPSLPARVVGRIGSLSPTVNRLRRSASTTSSATSASNLDLRLLGRDYDQVSNKRLFCDNFFLRIVVRTLSFSA